MGFAWPGRGFDGERPDDLIGQLGYHSFTADCSIVAGTWDAVAASAAIATTATDRLLDDGQTTFALCRPPGHHATADQFGGYCYVNNAAAAAQRMLNRGAARVAVLDVDYHHGNGTQSIFYDRSDVLFVSLHADPAFEFPWFIGRADETGRNDGEGWNLNLPLGRDTDLATYLETLEVGLARIGDAGVEGLVVSLGVDTYVDDPLGTFAINTPGFRTIASRIAALGLPTVLVQEGGYAVADIGTNVVSFLEGWG
jgi:acetoin utilization deacetylase AcuC-like enzyme